MSSSDTSYNSDCELGLGQNSLLQSEVCEVFVFDDNDSLARTPSLEYYYEPSINLGDIGFVSDSDDIVIDLSGKINHCKGCLCHVGPFQGHCSRCSCYQESGTKKPLKYFMGV